MSNYPQNPLNDPEPPDRDQDWIDSQMGYDPDDIDDCDCEHASYDILTGRNDCPRCHKVWYS
jgi:hypothetical protein